MIFYYNNGLRKYIMDSINKSMEKYKNKNREKEKMNALIKYYINPLSVNDKFLVYNFLASGLLCFIIGYKVGKGLRIK
jgi:hypothetical protein